MLLKFIIYFIWSRYSGFSAQRALSPVFFFLGNLKMEGSVAYQEGLNKRDPSQPSMTLVLWIWKRSLSFQLFDLDVDNSFTRGVLAKFELSLYFLNAKAFAYGNPTRNEDHHQNKHNEDNTITVRLSPGELPGVKWRQLKRRNQPRVKNTPLSKQCLGMKTKAQKIAEIERTRREALQRATSGVPRCRSRRAVALDQPKKGACRLA